MYQLAIRVIFIILSVGFLYALNPVNSQRRLTTNKEMILTAGNSKIVPQSLLDQQQKRISQADQHKTNGIYPVKSGRGDGELLTRDCGGDCWNLQHVRQGVDWYFTDGFELDTFAVVFQAAAPCIVQEVYQKWWEVPGHVNAFGAIVSEEALEATNGLGASINLHDGTTWLRGSAEFSPVGQLLTTPTENYIEGYVDDWSVELNVGGEFQVGDENDLTNNPPFLIAYVKQFDYIDWNYVSPFPIASNVNSDLSFNWCSLNGEWGNYYGFVSSPLVDISMQVRVTYPWGAPIAANLDQLSNTFATNDTRIIKVELVDDIVDGIGVGDGDVVSLIWAIDGIVQPGIDLSSASMIDVDEFGNGIYGFELNYSVEPGSEITYWIASIDDDGLSLETFPLNFFILTPQNPDADLLIIADHAAQNYFQSYGSVIQGFGCSYELWDIFDNNGIHSSVIDHGWTNIFIYGWGNESLPVVAGEYDPGYGEFLANGGNLLIADQDWFYGHDLPAYPEELTFIEGDPAHDWFGLIGGVNDPEQYEVDEITALIDGLSDITIGDEYDSSTLWTDILHPGGATPIFSSSWLNGEVVGVQYEVPQSGSRTAMMSFQPALCNWENEQAFINFIQYFLIWFDIASPPQAILTGGPSDIIYNDMGQEVFAEINDVNGDVFTAQVCWSVNGGAAECADMAETVRSEWSGMIPAQEGGSNMIYWVKATDVDGTASSGSGTYFVFAPGSDVLFVLNNEMETTDYPGMYYFYDAYVLDDLYLYPDFWNGPIIDPALISFYDIIFEITTTFYYPYYGGLDEHYAIIHDWLIEGGKSYFLGGDETFGLVNVSWEDEVFPIGSFFNSLGIAESRNDIAWGGVTPLNAVEHDLISGALYDAAIAEGASLLYDPEYEIGKTNYLDGVVPTNDANVFLTSGDIPVGVWKEWDNGNKTVFCGFDPLSINSDPYVWWGATQEGPSISTLMWFLQSCENTTGDVNEDGDIDILDVVMLVGGILGNTDLGECALMSADANEDGYVDILDLVTIVFMILPERGQEATSASILQTDAGVQLQANGSVGAIQMELSHSDDFSITLIGNAIAADHITKDNITTLIIVGPGEELFTVVGDYTIENVIAGTTQGYLDMRINIPTEYSLSPAYPNPFNPVTQLDLALPEATHTSIKIYNIAGRLVTVLLDDHLSSGYHTITWDAASTASGVYFIQVIAGEHVTNQKALLLK